MSKISFGPRLKALRLQSKFPSATDFAAALGISRASLYLWEGSDDPPPPKHWDQICAVLGISEKHLLLGQEESNNSADGVQENQTPYAADSNSIENANRIFQETLRLANGDRNKIGWIIEQLRLHLRPPEYWRMYQGQPEDHPAVKAALARAQEKMNQFSRDEDKKAEDMPPSKSSFGAQ